ncbi:MAG TPA: hypothetical protein VI895_14890 [Bdellovibrionota bacterium]|nr:hypothetical protein [Bdellovibrionota bacterium]
MKQPRLNDLRLDRKGTKELRSSLARAKKVKITINVDQESLVLLRTMAGKTGTPYQRLLNQILKEGLGERQAAESRIERIEKEIENLKRQLAA